VTNVSDVVPEFTSPADSFFAQTVSGDVGNLSPGQYEVGLCVESETSNTANGAGSVTITLAQTSSGVTYLGPRDRSARAGRQ
jgi:hypothetical protein